MLFIKSYLLIKKQVLNTGESLNSEQVLKQWHRLLLNQLRAFSSVCEFSRQARAKRAHTHACNIINACTLLKQNKQV